MSSSSRRGLRQAAVGRASAASFQIRHPARIDGAATCGKLLQGRLCLAKSSNCGSDHDLVHHVARPRRPRPRGRAQALTRGLKAPTTASFISNMPNPRCSYSTMAGSSRRPTIPTRVSWPAPSRTRPSAMHIPPALRACAGTSGGCGACGQGEQIQRPLCRAAWLHQRSPHGDDNPLGAPDFETKAACWRRSTPMFGPKTRAYAKFSALFGASLAGDRGPARRR